MGSTFELRWLLWLMAALFLLSLGSYPFLGRNSRAKLSSWMIDYNDKTQAFFEKHFNLALFFLCFSFFVVGWIAKITQFKTLNLNAQDFWLFEDMLRQMAAGQPFLTRFAPQGAGWVQHGAIHSFWSFYVLVPFSWLLGPTQACLLFGPLVLAAASFFLGKIAKPLTSARTAWGVSFAFLASTQVGKILDYDVHPEAAFPLALFMWFWSAKQKRGLLWAFALFFGIGLREDSFLIMGPVLLWGVLHGYFKKDSRFFKISWVSLLAGVGLSLFQLFSLHQFSRGHWGLEAIEGFPAVILPGTLPFLGGQSISLSEGPWTLFTRIFELAGGLSSVLKRLALFWISRPWLSLLIFAPWLITSLKLWFWILPAGFLLALIGGWPATLIHYYSAFLLGGFWLALVHSPLPKRRLIWVVIAVCLFGDGGIRFYRGTPELSHLLTETQELLTQIPAPIPNQPSLGLVSVPLLGVLPENLRARVLTEKYLSPGDSRWNSIHFVLLTPTLPRWEMRENQIDQLIKDLTSNPMSAFKKIPPQKLDEPGKIHLYLRNGPR